MDDKDFTSSALDALDNVSFKVGLRGYDMDEVDDFLDRLGSEVRELRDVNAAQLQQLRQASERIAQLDARGPQSPAPAAAPAPAPRALTPESSDQVSSMIQMAAQFVEQMRAEAELKAGELTQSAQERAKEIVADARSRAEDEVTRLNGMKQRLSEDVDALRGRLDSDRARLRDVLSELSRWVEQSLRDQSTTAAPAPSAPAPAPVAPVSAPVAPAPVSDVRPATPPPAAPPASPRTIGEVLPFGDENRN